MLIKLLHDIIVDALVFYSLMSDQLSVVAGFRPESPTNAAIPSRRLLD